MKKYSLSQKELQVGAYRKEHCFGIKLILRQLQLSHSTTVSLITLISLIWKKSKLFLFDNQLLDWFISFLVLYKRMGFQSWIHFLQIRRDLIRTYYIDFYE